VSLAILPGLSVRMRISQSAPGHPSVPASPGVIHMASALITRISANETRPSQPIRATVPLAMVLSNQYRKRARNVVFATKAP